MQTRTSIVPYNQGIESTNESTLTAQKDDISNTKPTPKEGEFLGGSRTNPGGRNGKRRAFGPNEEIVVARTACYDMVTRALIYQRIRVSVNGRKIQLKGTKHG